MELEDNRKVLFPTLRGVDDLKKTGLCREPNAAEMDQINAKMKNERGPDFSLDTSKYPPLSCDKEIGSVLKREEARRKDEWSRKFLEPEEYTEEKNGKYNYNRHNVMIRKDMPNEINKYMKSGFCRPAFSEETMKTVEEIGKRQKELGVSPKYSIEDNRDKYEFLNCDVRSRFVSGGADESPDGRGMPRKDHPTR